ncbi:MAG: serine/threonine protein kinase, partial [Rothia mucilaginosa]|nr:serine/threonine protein kinase [Rothia mucilaginosa]
FVGLENDQQVLYHNANIEMPPLGDIAPGIDRDMAGIIAWCTRKQPQARPKDATELFASLKEVSESLGESELSWRAPSVPEPTSSLWEAVADIAERSGAGQMVRNTPISAFSDAGDLLAYDVYSPDSLLIGSQDGVHLADVDAEDSVLNPEGIPPLKSSVPEASAAADAAESSESDDSRESKDLKSSGTSPVASDAPAGGAASMPSVSGGGPVGIGPQTEQEFISTFGEYAPIHAERAFNAYLDYPGSTESLGEAYTAEGSQQDSGGSTGSEASKFALREATHRDRRLPVRELAPPPSGIAMGVWALLVILLGMSASFGGWWLATSILQSEWWKNFTSFFGLGY